MQITKKIYKVTRKYLKEINLSLKKLPLTKIEKIAEILYRAYQSGKKIILIGNGGSAATASHFVCDLGKGTAFPGKKRFKVLALCDNVPLLTAYANDRGYEHVFAEPLKNLLDEDDVVIAISASGNSGNVLKAVSWANKSSAVTIGLTGFRGGKLKSMVSECIVVSNNKMEQIEDIHLIVLHLLKLFLKSLIEENK